MVLWTLFPEITKVTFIFLSLAYTMLLSEEMLEAPTIDLSDKNKIRSNFLRPYAVVTNTTGFTGCVPSAPQLLL